MAKYGLIGYPLSHSFSKTYFTEKFKKENNTEDEYLNFPIEVIDDLGKIIKEAPGLKGLNVTIPYKEKVLRYLNELDDTVKTIGAANTIKITRDGDDIKLSGYNSDVIGFGESIKPLLKRHHQSALILGTGGASKAVEFALNNLGLDSVFVSRSPKPGTNSIGYNELCLPVIKNFTVIINTSPLGTYPNIDTFPDIPYDLLSEKHLLYDLVYNPAETLFLKKGKEKGAKTMNGLQMLHLQAEESWRIWNS